MTSEQKKPSEQKPPLVKKTSHTRPAERPEAPPLDVGKIERELVRLRRENQLLRSQLRTTTPIPRSTTQRRRGIATPRSLSPAEIIGDRYELKRLLAKGGMGAVWVARDLDAGFDVALKLLRDGADQEEMLRFQREARVSRALRSEHVARVFDDGVDEGIHYIAMELLEGESLSSLMRRRSTLTLLEVVQLVTDMRAALEPAHAAGIVHRDLKPQNLFLGVGEGGSVVLKLLDFGVAKHLGKEEDMTSTGAILGSPNYMSPEQARGTAVDHRTDLWSTGVILYRVLTGTRPWEGDNSLELLLRICNETPPPPSTHVAGLPPAIDVFFERALAQDADERFQSIGELAQAFVAAAACASLAPPLAHSTRSPLSSWAQLRAQASACDSAPVPEIPAPPPLPVLHEHLVPVSQRPRRAAWPLWAALALGVVVALALLVWLAR